MHWQFPNRFAVRLVAGLAIALLIQLLAAPTARAALLNLASGTSGTTVSGQSYNETRGVDVTVLTGSNLQVSSMRLDGLSIGSATSALVGARIYNSSTTLLTAFANTTIFSSGPVTIPIAATLTSGANYRIAFYVQTTPLNQGSAAVFDPAPPGAGGFPYNEPVGFLRINSAHSIVTDSFPTTVNNFVPQITVDAAIPEPASVALLGLGAFSMALRRRPRRIEKRRE